MVRPLAQLCNGQKEGTVSVSVFALALVSGVCASMGKEDVRVICEEKDAWGKEAVVATW